MNKPKTKSTGLEKVDVVRICDGHATTESEYVPQEDELIFCINNKVEAKFCCAPHHVKHLAIGWLIGEGIIRAYHEFVSIETDLLTNRINIRVTDNCFRRMQNRIKDSHKFILEDNINHNRKNVLTTVHPDKIIKLCKDYRMLFLRIKSNEKMQYLCCMTTGNGIVGYGEGFHRINSVYRALGEIVYQKKETKDKIIIANFGLTRSIVKCLINARVAIVIGLAPPSTSAIELAEERGICLIQDNYSDGIKVYSAPYRVV